MEVERCFGFADGYTAIPGAKDSPRYTALGNSMAVPVIRWLGERILKVDEIVRPDAMPVPAEGGWGRTPPVSLDHVGDRELQGVIWVQSDFSTASFSRRSGSGRRPLGSCGSRYSGWPIEPA